MSVPDVLRDEVVKAARRVVDERVRYAEPIYHDGTEMVLVPRGIYDRLERAILLHTDIAGRPQLREPR